MRFYSVMAVSLHEDVSYHHDESHQLQEEKSDHPMSRSSLSSLNDLRGARRIERSRYRRLKYKY